MGRGLLFTGMKPKLLIIAPYVGGGQYLTKHNTIKEKANGSERRPCLGAGVYWKLFLFLGATAAITQRAHNSKYYFSNGLDQTEAAALDLFPTCSQAR